MSIWPECPDGHAKMIILPDFLDGRSWMSFMVGRFHRRRANFPLTIEVRLLTVCRRPSVLKVRAGCEKPQGLCRFPSLSPPGDHSPSSVQYVATQTFAVHHVVGTTALDTSLSDYIAYYTQTAQPISWTSTIEKLEQKLGAHL